MTVSRLLTGTRVRLNAVKPEDVPIITRWYESNLFVRLLEYTPAYPRTLDKMHRWYNEDRGKDSFLFAIRPVDDDRLMGFIELDGIMWANSTGWVGIAISDEYQNQGFGYEAMQLCLQFAFNELNLHRVQLTVFEYNERAVHLYEKLGFVHEGTQREAIHRDGQRYGLLTYGILRHEWEGFQR